MKKPSDKALAATDLALSVSVEILNAQEKADPALQAKRARLIQKLKESLNAKPPADSSSSEAPGPSQKP